MHAFIVRPFGIKKGIDFDRVESELIRPALQQLGCSGGTTGEFIQQGNIRSDMFEQLLIADLVVADISIHNANTFYELGIRHAFRDKRTFLIRSQGDEVPFDLKTDRYLSYDAADPAACLPVLVKALQATWASQHQDSPVFQLLPGLPPADPGKFLVVPLDFHEELARAESAGDCGNLQLLSAEMDGLAWKTAGLRLIGNAQFRCKDWQGARVTWEKVRGYDETDLEANTLLGTVYQRLDDLVRADQALKRALHNTREASSGWHRAELYALMGRNAKTLWEREWQPLETLGNLQKTALTSPYLRRSFDLYRKGFIEDRNHFYSGLNALALITIITELAVAQPETWQDEFELEEDAELELRKQMTLRGELAVGVKLAIRSRSVALQREEKSDVWVDISSADLALLTSGKPSLVGRAYRKALANAPGFARDSARRQLLRFEPLGILRENTLAALDNVGAPAPCEETPRDPPHVILFTGHRIDSAGRDQPRFPAQGEQEARAMIAKALAAEKDRAGDNLLGICGCASGGDILFHEVCEELGIPSRVYLVLPEIDYIKASVADAGADWVERFRRLLRKSRPKVLSDDDRLPRWLRAKPGYSIWQRSNLWMLYHALTLSAGDLTLLALWDGQRGDGPGGTEDMVKRAQDRGARFVHLDARKLIH